MIEAEVKPKLRKFIRHKALKELLPFGDTQITKLQRLGLLPKSFRLPGGRDRIYDADEVAAFQEKILADRDAGLLADFLVTGAVAKSAPSASASKAKKGRRAA